MLNRQLGRTEFMPFAPVTLVEHSLDRYVDAERILLPGRFMTITCYCTGADEARVAGPPCTLDGTARPQIVRREDNPGFHASWRSTPAHGHPDADQHVVQHARGAIAAHPRSAVRAFPSRRTRLSSMGPFLVVAGSGARSRRAEGGGGMTIRPMAGRGFLISSMPSR